MKQKNNYIIMVVVTISVFFTACGQATEDIKESVEATSSLTAYEETTSCYEAESTTAEESTTVSETTEVATTSESVTETTTVEQTTEATTQQETTTQPSTTTKQQETTKKQETTTKKKEKETEEETTISPEDIPDGVVWQYRSNIYANDPVKSELEQKFWDNFHWAETGSNIREYGWTIFSKKKNDEMVVAIVELVYDIMQKNKTDFERERALYEAICLTCNYDRESLDTGLTKEGQTPYGVLIEHKAVCGGYASTFRVALSMMGIENQLIKSSVKNGGLHAWNQVCLDGEWYEVDVTWGDGDDGFSYSYFNITSEEMAVSHYIEGNNCTGTKYSEKYLIDKYLPEFLADKVYLSTVDEVINYINTQAENGIAKTVVCTSEEVYSKVCDIICDPVIFNEKYPFSDKINQMYCEYGFACEYAPYYKHVFLEGIGMIEIEYRLVEEFKALDNFFETQEDIWKYIDEQLAMGNYEISFYHDIPDGTVQIVPNAPEGLRAHARYSNGTDSYRAIGNLRHVEVTYYELETEEQDIYQVKNLY